MNPKQICLFIRIENLIYILCDYQKIKMDFRILKKGFFINDNDLIKKLKIKSNVSLVHS